MDNFYQINLPSRLASVNHDLNPSVNPLAASCADQFSISGTFSSNYSDKILTVSLFGSIFNDISYTYTFDNLKKEVKGKKMNKLQHCRSIQYNMKLSFPAKFFNN